MTKTESRYYTDGEKAGTLVNKFKIICPDCGAAIITSSPTAVIWELCPGCHRHIWDSYDAMMADPYSFERHDLKIQGVHADN